MPSPAQVILAATIATVWGTPSHAQNCADSIDPAKPINPIIACLKELGRENAALRKEIAELVAKPSVPGPQGEPGEKGEQGPPGTGAEIPSGAVMAFEGKCPEVGWSIYAPATARFIIGAGETFDPKHRKWKSARPGGGFDEIDLTFRELGTSDGEERHILQEPEMPIHNHYIVADVGQPPLGAPLTATNYIKREDWSSGNDPAYHLKGTSEPATVGVSSPSGGFQPHNNMPPYIALNYCRKN